MVHDTSNQQNAQAQQQQHLGIVQQQQLQGAPSQGIMVASNMGQQGQPQMQPQVNIFKISYH